jgi:hypothetical protein
VAWRQGQGCRRHHHLHPDCRLYYPTVGHPEWDHQDELGTIRVVGQVPTGRRARFRAHQRECHQRTSSYLCLRTGTGRVHAAGRFWERFDSREHFGKTAGKTNNVNLVSSRDAQVQTHRVPWLLGKDLSKLYHVWIISQFLGKINHVICGILLIARTVCSKKVIESSNSDGVALQTTACFILKRHAKKSFRGFHRFGRV